MRFTKHTDCGEKGIGNDRLQGCTHPEPDQLTDYYRVTNPGIWVILSAVILLLAGVFA